MTTRNSCFDCAQLEREIHGDKVVGPKLTNKGFSLNCFACGWLIPDDYYLVNFDKDIVGFR
jgi:hypothetical protein